MLPSFSFRQRQSFGRSAGRVCGAGVELLEDEAELSEQVRKILAWAHARR